MKILVRVPLPSAAAAFLALADWDFWSPWKTIQRVPMVSDGSSGPGDPGVARAADELGKPSKEEGVPPVRGAAKEQPRRC